MGDLDPVHPHLCSDVQTLNSSRFLMIPRLYVLIHSHSLLFVLLWKLWMTHPKTHAVLWVKLEWQKNPKKTRLLFFMRWSPSRDDPTMFLRLTSFRIKATSDAVLSWTHVTSMDGRPEHYLTLYNQIITSTHVFFPTQPCLTLAPSDAEKLIPDFVPLRLEY